MRRLRWTAVHSVVPYVWSCSECQGTFGMERAENAGRLTVHVWHCDVLPERIEEYDEHQRKLLPLVR